MNSSPGLRQWPLTWFCGETLTARLLTCGSDILFGRGFTQITRIISFVRIRVHSRNPRLNTELGGAARDVLQLRSAYVFERAGAARFLLSEVVVDEAQEFTKREFGMFHQQMKNSFKLLDCFRHEPRIKMRLVVNESQQELRARHDQPVERVIVAIKRAQVRDAETSFARREDFLHRIVFEYQHALK